MTQGTMEIHWGGDFTADSIYRVEGVLDFYFDPSDLSCNSHMVRVECSQEEYAEIVHSLLGIQWPESGGAPLVSWIPYETDRGSDPKSRVVDPKSNLRHLFDRPDRELYEVRETLRLQDFRFNKDRIAAGETMNVAWGADSFRTKAMQEVMALYGRKVHVSCREAMDAIDALRYELDVMRGLVNSNEWRD